MYQGIYQDSTLEFLLKRLPWFDDSPLSDSVNAVGDSLVLAARERLYARHSISSAV